MDFFKLAPVRVIEHSFDEKLIESFSFFGKKPLLVIKKDLYLKFKKNFPKLIL